MAPPQDCIYNSVEILRCNPESLRGAYFFSLPHPFYPLRINCGVHSTLERKCWRGHSCLFVIDDFEIVTNVIGCLPGGQKDRVTRHAGTGIRIYPFIIRIIGGTDLNPHTTFPTVFCLPDDFIFHIHIICKTIDNAFLSFYGQSGRHEVEKRVGVRRRGEVTADARAKAASEAKRGKEEGRGGGEGRERDKEARAGGQRGT